METTTHVKGDNVVLRVHRDTSKVLADGSPDPAWVWEGTFPSLPTNGVTLAQHLIACQQEAEKQAAAAPPPATKRRKASTSAMQTMTAQALTADEPHPLANGLTVKVVGNAIVVQVHVDADTMVGEWSWGGTPNEGQTFEQHVASCKRESLLLADHVLKQAMPTDTPLKLNM